MAKFVSTVVFNNAGLADLKNDPQAGEKIYNAINAALMGGDTTVSSGGQVVALAVESHTEDQTRLVAVSGLGGRDIGSAGIAANVSEGNERAMFEEATIHYGLVVRTKAEREGKKEGTAEAATGTAPSAPATGTAASAS